MTDRELRKHYLLLANFNETAIGALKARNMLPEGLEEKLREEFYATLEKEKERREQGVKKLRGDYMAIPHLCGREQGLYLLDENRKTVFC